jgi:hypothetical protein
MFGALACALGEFFVTYSQSASYEFMSAGFGNLFSCHRTAAALRYGYRSLTARNTSLVAVSRAARAKACRVKASLLD